MSVALMIEWGEDIDSRDMLPIAAQREFYEYWLPIATKYDLELILTFDISVHISRSSVPRLISEFRTVESALGEPMWQSISAEQAAHMQDRIHQAVEALQSALNGESEFVVYFC